MVENENAVKTVGIGRLGLPDEFKAYGPKRLASYARSKVWSFQVSLSRMGQGVGASRRVEAERVRGLRFPGGFKPNGSEV